jgi:hypothetical protein
MDQPRHSSPSQKMHQTGMGMGEFKAEASETRPIKVTIIVKWRTYEVLNRR